MIKLTRFDGSFIFLNERNILWVESSPDTAITFLNGARLLVREPVATVLAAIEENLKQECHSQDKNPSS